MVIAALSNLSSLPEYKMVPRGKPDWLILMGNCGLINESFLYHLINYRNTSKINRLIYMINDEDYYAVQNPEKINGIRDQFKQHGVYIYNFGESFRFDDLWVQSSGKQYDEFKAGADIILTLRPPARFKGTSRLPKRGCIRTSDYIDDAKPKLSIYSQDATPSFCEQVRQRKQKIANCNMRGASGRILYKPIITEL